MTRSNTVALVAVLVVVSTAVAGVVAVAPVQAADTTQDGVEVADGHTGSVDPGRQNDEQQQYPLNFSVFPTQRQPGSTGSGADYFAVGLTENVRLHWIVVRSEAFDFSSCEASDARAFGIDRGNDNSGTQTDKSLLTSYRSYESTENAIKIGYYKDDSGVTGQPVTINVQDQIVAAQRGCLGNPTEPGWYRISGKINGSTKQDAQTDYTINAGTQYIYVCDCENRQQAREKLGPPPNEQGDDGSGDDSGDGSGESTPTHSPSPTSGSDDGSGESTPTPSPTAGSGDDTPTATDGGTTATTGGTTTGGTPTGDTTPTATAGSAATATGGSNPGQDVGSTPTEGSGPGFGLLLAVGSLFASAALVARRRD